MTENIPQSKESKSEPPMKSQRHAVNRQGRSSNVGDILKLCVAAALVAGGVWIFYNNALGLPSYVQMAAPALGVILALFIVFYWCDFGRRLISYVRDSVAEFKKVVWPARNDAFRMTVFVIIFVTILAAFIYMADSIISWLFYDLLLKRG